MSTEIAGLLPDTTYHFRVIAVNFSGAADGPDQTFTTLGVPIVGDASSSNITSTSAVLSSIVNPDRSATTYHFDYGPSEAYGSRTPDSSPIGSDANGHTATAVVSGLTPSTTYHFRIAATNSSGTALGLDQTFTTAREVHSEGPQRSCKEGFVKRRGKCVARHHRRKHRGRRAPRK